MIATETLSDEDVAQPVHELRSFGRKRGRKPSREQARLLVEALPRWRIDLDRLAGRNPAGLFDTPVSDVWLEIGFGGAEHMVRCAARHPDVGILGCEPFEDGVVKALTAIERQGLRNVRLHPDDARPLLRSLPDASLGRIYVLYPDPWPKRRHAKRRLLRRDVLTRLSALLRPDAELRVATDISDYAATVLEEVWQVPSLCWTAETPADWRKPWPDWAATRYEEKALAAGRRPAYLRFVKRRTEV
ncbi:MAG: tRNA (guanine(46)-N(7))-methyltransferase TrmB [Hyphomicrobium sp.]|nr:tRNA (guanine(46)-N(7))-methyltransferase TrmB [Hyphomicrobium sp.]